MLESYLKEIQRYPLLSADEEVVLAKKIESGDGNAVNYLVQCNLRLVVSVAKKFCGSYKNSIMDLIQEGNLGLMSAASKFSYTFNTRFSTYAYPWILQYILRYIYGKTSAISLPHRKEELLRKVSNVQNEFFNVYNREPSIEELSKLLGVGEEEIREAKGFAYSVSSLDVEAAEDSSATVADLIPDSSFNPEKEFFKRLEEAAVMEVVMNLPEKERIVIYNRFNFDRLPHVPTLRELSVELGVSAETVRQLELRALKRMRKEECSIFSNLEYA